MVTASEAGTDDAVAFHAYHTEVVARELCVPDLASSAVARQSERVREQRRVIDRENENVRYRSGRDVVRLPRIVASYQHLPGAWRLSRCALGPAGEGEYGEPRSRGQARQDAELVRGREFEAEFWPAAHRVSSRSISGHGRVFST